MLAWRLVTNLFGNVFLYFQKVKALARLVSGGKSAPKCPYCRGGKGNGVKRYLGDAKIAGTTFTKGHPNIQSMT